MPLLGSNARHQVLSEMSHRSSPPLLRADLKATLVERIANAVNVPGDGAVFAWAQVVVNFVLEESTFGFHLSFQRVFADA